MNKSTDSRNALRKRQLHIKVDDQHIRGSPFPVAVKSPIEKLGTPILTIGGVEGPWGIKFNQRGEVVVAEEKEQHMLSKAPEPGQSLILDVDSYVDDVCSVAPELWEHIRVLTLSVNERKGRRAAISKDSYSSHLKLTSLCALELSVSDCWECVSGLFPKALDRRTCISAFVL